MSNLLELMVHPNKDMVILLEILIQNYIMVDLLVDTIKAFHIKKVHSCLLVSLNKFIHFRILNFEFLLQNILR